MVLNVRGRTRNSGPQALNEQGPGGHARGIQRAGGLKKQSVARHRVVGSRSGKSQRVHGAYGRDHDGCGHQRGAERGENRLQHGGCDAIRGSVLDGFERKRDEIGDVRKQIERDHDAGADGERERKIAARIFHFSRGESNVVPGIGGEKRAGLRYADRYEQTEGGGGAESGGEWRNAASGPGVAEIFVNAQRRSSRG